MSISDIKDLYDGTRFEYKGIAEANDLAMHYIMSDEKGDEDPELTYRTYFEALEVENGRVLDVGCGFGGNSIWIAENSDLEVTGIDINEGNLEQARKYAEGRGVSDKIDLRKMNFNKMEFKQDFEGIIAVESVCHSETPSKFLEKAFDALEPGARILIADGFQSSKELTEEEKDLRDTVADGWALPGFNTIDEFREKMIDGGFEEVEFEDKTKEMLTFSKGLYRYNIALYPVMKILNLMNLKSKWSVKQTRTNFKQKNLIDREIMKHGYFTAKKPD
jgi:cyclopropane fatty-acyl-phospholipid synthase-like methyltransferase